MNSPSVPITRPPALSSASRANTPSKSRSLVAWSSSSLSPSARAAGCSSLRLHLGVGIGRIDERADGRRRRDQAVQQLQPLRLQLHAQRGHAGEIAARPVQAGDQPERDRIGAGEEHDRNGPGRGLGGEHAEHLAGDGDHRDLSADQVGRQRRQPVVLLLRPAIFDRDVAALDIAGFAQALAERVQPARVAAGGGAAQEADHRQRRLRARGQRPGNRRRGRRAAEQRDELAPLHSITSSARVSTVAGTSRPSALAVLRLRISSYLIGACTGRSAGFSPLRMRST